MFLSSWEVYQDGKDNEGPNYILVIETRTSASTHRLHSKTMDEAMDEADRLLHSITEAVIQVNFSTA